MLHQMSTGTVVNHRMERQLPSSQVVNEPLVMVASRLPRHNLDAGTARYINWCKGSSPNTVANQPALPWVQIALPCFLLVSSSGRGRAFHRFTEFCVFTQLELL